MTDNGVTAIWDFQGDPLVKAEVQKLIPEFQRACLDGCRYEHIQLRRQSCEALFGFLRYHKAKVPFPVQIAVLLSTPVKQKERIVSGPMPVPQSSSYLHLCRVVDSLRKHGTGSSIAIPALRSFLNDLEKLPCRRGLSLKRVYEKGQRIPKVDLDALFWFALLGDTKNIGKDAASEITDAMDCMYPTDVMALRLLQDIKMAIDELGPVKLADVQNAIESSDFFVQTAAIESIRLLDSQRQTLAPRLQKLLQHEDPQIRFHAAIALASVDRREAAKALPVAMKAMKTNNPDFPMTRKKAIVPLLIDILRTENASAPRILVLQVLGEIGPEAIESIDDVRALFASDQIELRTPAATALKKIKSK